MREVTARREQMARWGEFFFRWRSYLPLLLLPVVPLVIARFRYPFGSHAADLAWEVACVALALGGVALRAWTVGVAAPGTSGRNTRHQKARSLNTTGSYSLVRHPLYLANSVIVLGLALFPHAWLVPTVAVLAAGYYACIAHREEQFLRARFGPEFEAWAARVPAMVPAFSGWVPPARPFDWRAAVRREFYGLTVVLVTPLGLDIVEDYLETGTFDLDPLWTVTAVVGAVLFLVIRALKKRTLMLDAPPAAD